MKSAFIIAVLLIVLLVASIAGMYILMGLIFGIGAIANSISIRKSKKTKN